jgi:hypothetical protein
VTAPANTSGGTFSSGSSSTVTIPATGPATSQSSFTYTTGSGGWVSDNLSATVGSSPGLANAIATLFKN